MAGRGNRKKQDNFEKIKREMAVKKRKAQTSPETVKDDPENKDLETSPDQENSVPVQDECRVTEVENTDIAHSDSITEQEYKEDIPEKAEENEIQEKLEHDEKQEITNTKIELVVFRVEDEEFALKISNVKEILRVPSITKLPNTPEHILGLCSLRGQLLPVMDCRKLFGIPDRDFNESSRIIVAEIQEKTVGLLSDKVLEVLSVDQSVVKAPPASIGGIDGGVLDGILVLDDGKRVVMLLNAEKIILTSRVDEVDFQQNNAENLTGSETEKSEEEQIVVFKIGTGEYAFGINDVKEIIRLPDIMKVPNVANHIEGVISLRNQLLAVIHLGKLLGMDCEKPDEFSRVIIINTENFSYGVIVDSVSNVLRVQRALLKESGKTADGNDAEFISGIYNLNDGDRLVMKLDPNKLVSPEEIKGAF